MSENGKVLASVSGRKENDHSRVLAGFCDELLQKVGKKPEAINGVAISIGPGSYTGLRIGLSFAKGLCYSLSKPLISISTLQLMAASRIADSPIQEKQLVVPMIDARRNEVYTAVYDHHLNEIEAPKALIVEVLPFGDLLQKGNSLVFIGNGAHKVSPYIKECMDSIISDVTIHASYMSEIAYKAFRAQSFSDLAYAEPFYLKEFYSPSQKRNQ